jgi:hypothetical protein
MHTRDKSTQSQKTCWKHELLMLGSTEGPQASDAMAQGCSRVEVGVTLFHHSFSLGPSPGKYIPISMGLLHKRVPSDTENVGGLRAPSGSGSRKTGV